jgi:glutamyl-tRNA synthetase/nondiscriminating glutamyl-tRNA synthetase
MLHVGNARTALYNWLFARHLGGKFLLRIEDTDVERSEVRFEDQLIEDLRWLGLDWDEGPEAGGNHGPYRQSERLDIYAKHTQDLLARNKAYRCFCTTEELDKERAEATATHQPQIYSGRCASIPADESKRRAATEPFAIRLRLPDHPLRFQDIVRGPVEFPVETLGDPILVRTSGMPVYNYVVTIDDALMEITHVIRGDDHISNTPRQVAIYEAFGWPVPKFAHLSTILGADRERLSKRHGATSISSFREMGILPEALANYLALLGWGAEDGKSETFTLPELASIFKLERVTASPAVFDFEKLNWLNRHYLKLAAPERIQSLARAQFGDKLPALNAAQSAWFAKLIEVFLSAVDHLDQLPAKTEFFFGFDAAAAKSEPENAAVLATEPAQKVLAAFAAKLGSHSGVVEPALFKQWMNELKVETGAKGKDLFHPVRILITGAHSGPEFDKILPLIEEGAALGLGIPSVRERVEKFFSA